jgi:hypothetical protein
MSKKKNSIEYCKGFEFALAVSQGEKDTDEGPEVWSSDFTVGYLDFFMQELMDIKADMGRINSELRNEIAKLREENRKIDKEETEFELEDACPTCGSYAWTEMAYNQRMCNVCGTITLISPRGGN